MSVKYLPVGLQNRGHIIEPNGHQKWFQDRKLHREDGPAAIWPDGSRFWYQEGKLHREDGPAAIYSNGGEEWYLDDVEITKPILLKISPKVISVFGPMDSESYRDFGGTRDGTMITFRTEEDAMLWYLCEK